MDDESEHQRERVKSGRPVKATAATKLIQACVIFQAICLEFGVTENEMRGQARSPNLRAARLEFCRRCEAAGINRPHMATLLNRNLSTIKQFLGLRPQPNAGSRPPLSDSAFEAQLTRGREILSAICAESGFTEEAIRSSAQTGTLPLARREFAHRCKAENISARAIAELLGRDHTTIYSFSGGLPGSDGNPALGRLPAILQEVCAKYRRDGRRAAHPQAISGPDFRPPGILPTVRGGRYRRCRDSQCPSPHAPGDLHDP